MVIRVLILGSGGAARAIAFALATRGATLPVSRSSGSKRGTAAVVRDLRDKTGVPIEDGPLSWTCSAIGCLMFAPDSLYAGRHVTKVDESCGAANLFRPELTVMDIVYNPRETKLLQEAKGRRVPDDFRAGDVSQSGRDAI